MAAMRHFTAIASALAAIFLFGCISSSVPSDCASVPSARLANCIYNYAVGAQDPFACYSIQNAEQRQTCLSDAANPAMQKALTRALQSQRETIFIEQQNNTQPAPAIAPQPPATECGSQNGTGKDVCIRNLSFNSSNVLLCQGIFNSSIRRGCIIDVARTTKNLPACDSLPNQTEQEICRAFAKGGE